MEKNENKVCSSSPSTPPPRPFFSHCWFFMPYSITISKGNLLTAFLGHFYNVNVADTLALSACLSFYLSYYTSIPSILTFINISVYQAMKLSVCQSYCLTELTHFKNYEPTSFWCQNKESMQDFGYMKIIEIGHFLH